MATILTDLSGRITASGGTAAPAGPPGPAGATITAQHVQALLSAIAGLTLSDLGWANASITLPAETLQDLSAASTAIGGGLRGKLTAVKARFNSRSTIDIRGCRVGQNPDYLRGVQCFFGRSGDLPTVTAPEWFQSFPSFGFQALADEAAIDSTASSGFSMGTDTLTGSDVQTAIQAWSDLSGAGTQLAFWTRLFAAGSEAFVAMDWRSSLPALQMESRLGDLSTASFAQVLQRLADVFEVPASARPNAAQIRALQQKQPLAQRLVQAEGRLQALQSQATPDQTDLQALQQELAALRQQVTPATAGAATSLVPSPSAPTAGPPAAPPSGTSVTTAQLQQELQSLQQALRTQLAPVDPFIQAVSAKLSHSNAALRFYLNLGWVLPVQSATSPESIYLLVMHAHRNQAIRRWAAVQWTGNIPRAAAALSGAISDVATRRYAALSSSHGGPGLQVVFAPTPAYMSHIVVLNGGNFSCTAQGSNATLRARAAQAQTSQVTDPLRGL
ncbi:MAG: hypothetical protein NZ528_09550 [Caldilineales bacterium]|nr:hypothetical protein [Caldilineales bacterium]